jgi:hypothetical protein
MNIDVTDEQRRQIEAHSACVVPMELIHVDQYGARYGDLLAEAMSSVVHDEFVIPQPWLDAAKPCERCAGSGVIADGEGSALDCPLDCRDGHPIVELRAPFPCPFDTDGDGDCWACARNPTAHGRVSLGRYTVELHADFAGLLSLFQVNGFDPLPVPGRDMVAVVTKGAP